ncbi:MAG: ORF6N domain-containing protein [Gallionella sp.]|nr:ORF6N domain-containing protein [Gallionella sp.]
MPDKKPVLLPGQIIEGIEGRIYSLRGQRVMLSHDLATLYQVETNVHGRNTTPDDECHARSPLPTPLPQAGEGANVSLREFLVNVLMQAVRRNIERFPDDFSFELTNQEVRTLRSQFVTLEGGLRTHAPHAFTEQGVAMLSSVLKSGRAVGVNIEIMRSFVKLRSMLESNKELAQKLAKLEQKYDAQFKAVFEAIRELMSPPPPSKKRRIGFVQDE